MKSYLSYFKLKFTIGLQYRASALAGISTQLFFGLVYIFVYIAFYESNSGSIPMPLDELISFLWLNQAFFALIYLWYKDKDIIEMIKNGDICYELCRPQDVYMMWASKILGERLSSALLRCLPVLVIASFLPSPYNLNLAITPLRLCIFLISFILSSLLMTFIILLYHIICLYTLDEKGIVNIFMVLSDILSGLSIPLPFFPTMFQNIANVLPFRYISDFPFRLYVGNLTISEGVIGIGMQVIWIIIIFFLGRFLMNNALKKAVIQEG